MSSIVALRWSFRCDTNTSRWWYSPLLPLNNSFPSSCRRIFTRFLLAISSHLARKRPADVFLDFLTNSSSIIIVFLNELSTAALTSPGSFHNDFPKAVYRYLEASPESNLANVLDVEQQSKKLQAISEDILQRFLEPTAYACDPVKIFLREVLAGLILEATVKRCSDAAWINGWIIYLLEDGEPELLSAIDVGVSGARSNANKEVSSTSANGLTHYNERSEPTSDQTSKLEHRRTLSRAESAMEEAMQEAKRLSELIAAEEATKKQNPDGSMSSENATVGQITPTSSQSELDRFSDDPPQIPADGSVIIMQSSEPASSFTSFDQIISRGRSSTLQSDSSGLKSSPIAPMTLHNANVSIFDDGEKASARAKPTTEFLLQIEPVSSHYPGWMIARKYADFESLHEVLRRISVVSGVPKFAQKHGTLPSWRSLTKSSLRSGLEGYLQDALSYDRLAESEGMKRFLEKDQGNARTPPPAHKGGFSFPSPAAFETMGKGMLDVLASAPKGAAGGGKAILGGVSGVLGGVGSLGQRRQSQATSPYTPRTDDANSTPPLGMVRKSQDSVRSSFSLPGEARRPPPLPPRSSVHILTHEEIVTPLKQIIPEAALGITLQNGSPTKPSIYQPTQEEKLQLHLPPPPSEIPDDYNTIETSTSTNELPIAYDCIVNPSPIADQSPIRQSISPARPPESLGTPITLLRREKPLSLDRKETQVAVELFFAVINELYTLSSAWNIRRTLLNAAKGFLLRPGNPKLEDIRLLLQKTMIEGNTSDANIAAHLSKLRANTMPTDEELKNWPPPPTEEEKEKLRVKARKLLVERGMPQALTAVMGAAASGEALGRVFDALQIQEVARGFMFALLQLGVRAITQ